MKCKKCGKDIRYGGMSAYFPAREMKLCPDCYKANPWADNRIKGKDING